MANNTVLIFALGMLLNEALRRGVPDILPNTIGIFIITLTPIVLVFLFSAVPYIKFFVIVYMTRYIDDKVKTIEEQKERKRNINL